MEVTAREPAGQSSAAEGAFGAVCQILFRTAMQHIHHIPGSEVQVPLARKIFCQGFGDLKGLLSFVRIMSKNVLRHFMTSHFLVI